MYIRLTIGDRERAVISRDGRFRAIYGPGTYWLVSEAEVHGITGLRMESAWADYLIKERSDVLDRHLIHIKTGDHEVAPILADGKLVAVLPPGSSALYWKDAARIDAHVIRVLEAPEVPRELAAPIVRIGASGLITGAVVDSGRIGLLFLENRFVRILEPGVYAFWTAASPRVELFDLRVAALEVPGQEILSKDKVSLRVNVSAEYRILDPVKARASVADIGGHLYRAVQLAVRQWLGQKTLEEILAEKAAAESAVGESLRAELAAIGVELRAIALKDVILPGEMREILNKVVTAEKEAQANLIRRREETAATRSLLNTAKLLEENPILVRLKELETLEKLTAKVERVTVHGGFEGLLTQLLEPAGKS